MGLLLDKNEPFGTNQSDRFSFPAYLLNAYYVPSTENGGDQNKTWSLATNCVGQEKYP
jgi:hypothetical protein